jgi:hypothetical protein
LLTACSKFNGVLFACFPYVNVRPEPVLATILLVQKWTQ